MKLPRAIEGIGSESFYRQALMIRETIYGEDSTELISTLEWLADTYGSGGEFDHAEPVYERMLSLWEKLAGKDNPMVAVKLDKLAAFYSKEGKPEKAREALERSVAIRARFLAVGLAHQQPMQLSKATASRRERCTLEHWQLSVL
ncbi:MAG: tetratricopeptide repeat protein [Bryobacteraceae bacterium]